MAEETRSYLSWSMWVLFFTHAVLAAFTCFVLMIINLMFLRSFRDIWFIWVWLIWGGLVFLHYKAVEFFHGSKWASWRKILIDKMKENIG
jgi:hypothetical protein